MKNIQLIHSSKINLVSFLEKGKTSEDSEVLAPHSDRKCNEEDAPRNPKDLIRK
jgi:hypothetical protein